MLASLKAGLLGGTDDGNIALLGLIGKTKRVIVTLHFSKQQRLHLGPLGGERGIVGEVLLIRRGRGVRQAGHRGGMMLGEELVGVFLEVEQLRV